MKRGRVVVAAVVMAGTLLGSVVVWQSQARDKAAEPDAGRLSHHDLDRQISPLLQP